MRPTPSLRLSKPLFKALLAAYREARQTRGAKQPTRFELYQCLLDAAILSGDVEAMDWFDKVEPSPESPETPVPLRAMLRRLRRRAGDPSGGEVRILEVARLITGNRPRGPRGGPSDEANPNLPVKWEDTRLVPHPAPHLPGSRPPPGAFHCPECCPSPRSATRGPARKQKSPGEEAEAFLESIGGELTDQKRIKTLNPAHGRSALIDRVFEAMLMMHRPNPVLVGPSGVGKSAILEGLALRLLNGEAPTRLRKLRLFRLDANLFRAQAGIIGRIEEFLEKLVHAMETVGPAALVIDEIHLLTGTGAHKDDPKGAEQYVREHLARGRLRILGTTTPGEYQRFIAEDKAFESRLVKIDVEEPSFAVARRMVRMAAKRMEPHYQAEIDPVLADAAATLATQFPTGKAMPLAAIEVLDWGLARADARGKVPEVADLQEALAEILGCEVGHIRQEGSAKLHGLEEALLTRIKGQGRALTDTVAALKPYSVGLKDKNRPAAVLLFAGPTGVGKTETARQIAASLFGSERRLIRVPMADLSDPWSATRLLGSGPGYVGHEKGGWLVRRIRETPACVLLLDEFDRAHASVRDLFLEAFDNARLVDSRGLEADLRHAIVVMTSNLGTGGGRTPGFTGDEGSTERDRLVRVLKTDLSAALVGRINAVIPFDPLSEEALDAILDLKLRTLEKRLGLKTGKVELDPDLRRRVLARGYAPATGARGLDEALEKLVVRPLSARILDEGLPGDGDVVRLGGTEVDPGGV